MIEVMLVDIGGEVGKLGIFYIKKGPHKGPFFY